jgi:ankyrin repeat protein
VHRWSLFSLGAAVLNNNWGSFCTLLSIGIDPNTTSSEAVSTPTSFISPLILAATSFNPTMLAALLAFGASPTVRTPLRDARTALHLACSDYQSIRSEFNKDAPEFVRHWSLARTHIADDDLPHLQRLSIQVLLENDAQIDAQDFHGRTPLMCSLGNGKNLSAASFLLGRTPSASLNATDFIGNTSLHQAVSDELPDVVDFCHAHGADLDFPNRMGETALAVAAKDGQLAMCRRLLALGARIGARDENGQNCLNIVIRNSQASVMQLFLQHLQGSPTESLEDILLDEDCRGWTCLHACIEKCEEESDTYHPLFELWISQLPKIDLDRQDPMGWSLLHKAVVYSEICAKTLLELGASPNLRDFLWGWSPLHLACYNGNMDLLGLLLAHDGDFHLRDDHSGWNALVLLQQTTDEMRLGQGDDFSPGFDDESEDAELTTDIGANADFDRGVDEAGMEMEYEMNIEEEEGEGEEGKKEKKRKRK